MLAHPHAAAQRARILELASAPFDAASRAECQRLLYAALAAQHVPRRPGSVETIWYLEGLFDRLLEP